MINLVSPIYWTQTFKTKEDKVWLVGMNNYRNWHYHTSNKFKTEFGEMFKEQLPNVVLEGKFTVHMKLFYKRVCDGSNVVPLIEKVLLDVLQKEGVILNDNVKYHIGTDWVIAKQDKANPRVEITIKPV